MRYRAALLLVLLTGLGSSPERALGEASWMPTAPLAAARTEHTATLLPSGKVLVAGGRGGGWDQGGPLSSAELYDPATGAWTPTGPLANPRSAHTATLLPSGRVLVVGGNDPTAELYDPESGEWQETGSPAGARTGHTATLLPSGQVLAVGGDGAEASPTAELYDPATGTWKPAGSLANARARHTATLLVTGKVLVVGGSHEGRELSSAEIYDGAAGTWASTGSLAEGRAWHSAALLSSGKVLVTGGRDRNDDALSTAEVYDPAAGTWASAGSLAGHPGWRSTAILLPSGKVLVAGMSRGAAELYDPKTGTWSETAGSTVDRYDFCATLLPSGKVLVSGGESSIVPQKSAELYHPGGGTWEPTATLDRHGHSATLLPWGRVLAAGGNDGRVLSSARLYDLLTREWTATGPLAVARYDHSATLLPSGKVLVAGGSKAVDQAFDSAEVYDPATGTWAETRKPMVKARESHTATLLLSGKVLVVGGAITPDSFDSSAELYDPATGTWAATGSLLSPRIRSGYTATLLPSGQVLVAGGAPGNSSELYDPATGTWTETGELVNARINHTATLLPSGRVLVAGGRLGGVLGSAELYHPATGRWTETGRLHGARDGHTATLLPSGQVLVAGGTGDSDPYPLASELYDPATGTWTAGAALATGREGHTSTLLVNGRVLLSGGRTEDRSDLNAELYKPAGLGNERRPVITSVPPPLVIRYGKTTTLTGTGFGGVSEASGGGTQNSAVNYPLIQMLSIEGGQLSWLVPDPRRSFRDDPMTLTVSDLPPTLNPGWHLLTVITAGVPSVSRPVKATCGLRITEHPADQRVPLGSAATFRVRTRGGRTFQWQKDGDDIPGATGPSYTTPPISGDDSGTTYRVEVGSGCTSGMSEVATLTAEDDERPRVAVVSPSGGEYWLLSDPGAANTEVVTWSMSDNVRICRVEVSLLYSKDGGDTYQKASGPDLPATFGPGGTCRASEKVSETSVRYRIPETAPSGSTGSLYKVVVRVTDHAGRSNKARSENPFYMVRPNPESVKTLILANIPRMRKTMGITDEQAASLTRSLQLLADHPRVEGRVVDLDGVTELSQLYNTWDSGPADARKANRVLFGQGGVHDHLLNLFQAYTGVEYVVLVGDDRIIPMARIQDRTVLLLEENYPAGGDLSAKGTTVGQALAANKYLSDDPLAVLDRVRPDRLSGSLFIPDLALGRLVESPEEIVKAIATFISQGGILDLSARDSTADHRVMVTGYDFLVDSAKKIRRRWKNAFGLPHVDRSLAPVDGYLVGESWGGARDRPETLRDHLVGRAESAGSGELAARPYGIVSLNGHATHYLEGVPGSGRLDIRGLETEEIRKLDLAGSVVYAVGCHGGLPVAGSSSGGPDHSLDLPQTLLSRGVQVYLANTGYGWGLTHGIGYGERLVELVTEELARSGTIVVGDAYQQAKLRYRMEAPQFDDYDQKSLMQWAFFGFPMYAVRTGIDDSDAGPLGLQAKAQPGIGFGEVPVERQLAGSTRVAPGPGRRGEAPAVVPPYLTRLSLHFDLKAPEIYTKYNASGDLLPADLPGCPDPDGCYYALNGRATGVADLPIQPYFIYDSRLSGTSQHGVLWLGGDFEEESGWRPVVGELVSNGEVPEQDPIPEHIIHEPDGPHIVPGRDPAGCRPSDQELNSLVVTTGEVLREKKTGPWIERRHRTIDLEVFYFNDPRDASANCDRSGPELGPGPYHQIRGSTIDWAVPASDQAGVWRVVVVTNDGSLAGRRHGRWQPLELMADGGGTWRGSRPLSGTSRLTYFIQAVDRRGNVAWLEQVVSAEQTASGVDREIPLAVNVELALPPTPAQRGPR